MGAVSGWTRITGSGFAGLGGGTGRGSDRTVSTGFGFSCAWLNRESLR